MGESSMPQSCANTHMRSPSFDFCMDLCDDDTPANACPPCTPIVELEDGQVHAEAGSDSDMDELDYAQYTGTSFSTRAAVIDRVELECSNCVQMDYAWRQCIRAAGHAVCEAYSDEEEMDGAEIFRDEGEDGLQGPGVPEGAVAGVIVIQPDGSPCIGWLVAHPTIVRHPFPPPLPPPLYTECNVCHEWSLLSRSQLIMESHRTEVEGHLCCAGSSFRHDEEGVGDTERAACTGLGAADANRV